MQLKDKKQEELTLVFSQSVILNICSCGYLSIDRKNQLCGRQQQPGMIEALLW